MFYFKTAISLGILLALQTIPALGADFIGVDSRSLESDSGVIRLEWEGIGDDSAAVFELQKSIGPEFLNAEQIYSGSDRSTHLTGLREGDYFFRVREVDDPAWSEPLQVRVEFISRGKLFALLGIGFVVCALTIGSILRGHMESEGR